MTDADFANWTAPDIQTFEVLAAEALSSIPEPFASHAKTIAIQIVDFPPDHVLRDLDIGDPFELTGLYDGIPLTEKSSAFQEVQPDAIWLFRRPILDEWADRGNEPLGRLIAHILVHELAHHFGWSDEDIAVIDEWWR